MKPGSLICDTYTWVSNLISLQIFFVAHLIFDRILHSILSEDEIQGGICSFVSLGSGEDNSLGGKLVTSLRPVSSAQETYDWYPLESCKPLLEQNRYACFSNPGHSIQADPPEELLSESTSLFRVTFRLSVAFQMRSHRAWLIPLSWKTFGYWHKHRHLTYPSISFPYT